MMNVPENVSKLCTLTLSLSHQFIISTNSDSEFIFFSKLYFWMHLTTSNTPHFWKHNLMHLT